MTKKRKNRFANGIIVFCIAVAAVVTAAVLWEYHRLRAVIPSGVLGVLFGFWGGELLLVALRQIFGSDLPAKISPTKEKKSAETDGEGI